MNVEVLHAGEHLLVVNKPSGLPTTSPDGTGCLVEEVQRLDPDAPRLHASSRLDAEVTGVVIFARTRQATTALLDARRLGTYVRHYVALCEHGPAAIEAGDAGDADDADGADDADDADDPDDPDDRGDIDDAEGGNWSWAVGLDPNQPRRRVALSPDAPGGKPALTRYRVRVRLPRHAVIDLWPQTGRTHQLRVHAKAAGCPMLGDRHYGGTVRLTSPDGRVARAGRVMLHCAEVTIPDPASGAALRLRAPLPPDMCALHAALAPQAGPL